MRLALCWPPCTRSVTTVRPWAPAPAALAGRLLPQGAPAAHAHGSAGRRTGAGLTSKTPTNARIAVVAGFLPRCGAARVHPAARCGPGDPWWQPWALRQDTGFLSDPRRTALDQEAPLGRLREGAGAGWAGQLASTQHICRWSGVTREAAVGTRSLLAPRPPPRAPRRHPHSPVIALRPRVLPGVQQTACRRWARARARRRAASGRGRVAFSRPWLGPPMTAGRALGPGASCLTQSLTVLPAGGSPGATAALSALDPRPACGTAPAGARGPPGRAARGSPTVQASGSAFLPERSATCQRELHS